VNGNLFERPSSAPAASSEWVTAHCDGGSRGNPGPSGRIVARLSEYLGRQTNNYAEYSGLLAVLAWALEHGHKRLRVISDSELMVKQMKGQYKVASPGLRPLWEEARRLAARLDKFEMGHTLRGGNKEADRLANEAMDKGMGRPVGAPAGPAPARQPIPIANRAGARDARQAPAPAPPRSPRQVLEGYVKDGVVHLLEGELPDGIFVKVIKE
jgi:ribonuclease HI